MKTVHMRKKVFHAGIAFVTALILILCQVVPINAWEIGETTDAAIKATAGAIEVTGTAIETTGAAIETTDGAIEVTNAAIETTDVAIVLETTGDAIEITDAAIATLSALDSPLDGNFRIGVQLATPDPNQGYTSDYPDYPNPGFVRMTKNAVWDETNTSDAAIVFDIWGRAVGEAADILLIIDDSGSMSGSPIAAARSAANAFLDVVFPSGGNTDSRVALIKFGSHAYNLSGGFSTDAAALHTAVNTFNAGSGGTGFTDALTMAKDIIGDRNTNEPGTANRPTYIVFMSDGMGESARHWSSITNALKDPAGSYRTIIYAIGIGAASDTQLREISSSRTPPSGQQPDYGYDASDPDKYLKLNVSIPDLTTVFQGIAGNILIAGKNAVLTDKINTNLFTLRNPGDPAGNIAVQVENGIGSGVFTDLAPAAYAFNYDTATETLQFALGDINATRIRVIINITRNNTDAVDSFYDTNDGLALLSYDNWLGNSAGQTVLSPQLGPPVVQLRYVLTDVQGNLISRQGDPINSVTNAVTLSVPYAYLNEFGQISAIPVDLTSAGNIGLDAGTFPPSVADTAGENYSFAATSHYWTNDILHAMSDALTIQRNVQVVYLGYGAYIPSSPVPAQPEPPQPEPQPAPQQPTPQQPAPQPAPQQPAPVRETVIVTPPVPEPPVTDDVVTLPPAPVPETDQQIIAPIIPPLSAPVPTWALLNLLLAVLTALLLIALVVTYFTRRESDQPGYSPEIADESTMTRPESEALKRYLPLRLLAVIPAVSATVLFLLTENVHRTMEFVDSYTGWMMLIAVVQIVLAICARKRV